MVYHHIASLPAQSSFLHSLPHLGHSAHQLRGARPLDTFLFRLVERFGMKIMSALLLVFLDFHLDAILRGPRILADAGHLPRDLYDGHAGSDREPVAFDLARNYGLSELADDCQLIPEV